MSGGIDGEVGLEELPLWDSLRSALTIDRWTFLPYVYREGKLTSDIGDKKQDRTIVYS